ncbi:SCP2 sterol-binding domain-containing protein [Micromonospora sp. IBHARD004]|uniref:SCP2 sterol-binding domain-containing protein n=1 Tax=Micromonospora sp. IBHARD004 TaxID=3457764 RepID=UPI004058D599
MSDPIGAFFDRLAGGGYERLLRKTRGTVRFELTGDDGVDIWHLTIADGRVAVSREPLDADALICTDRASFARITRGEAKPLAAWLRNDLTIDGQFGFVVLLERLVAAPPGARHPRAMAGDRQESA